MRKALSVAALAAALVLFGSAYSEEEPTSQPAETHVYLALTNGEHINGVPLEVDEENLTLRVCEEERTIPLSEIEPVSVYVVKKLFVDLTDASVRMELGRFLLEHGELALAQREFDEAVEIDASLAEEAKELIAGGAEKAKEDQATSRPASEANEDQEPTKYAEPTAEEIEANDKRAREIAEKAKTFVPALHLIETKHFLIFSAWQRGRDRSLADSCEKMYATNCRQFDVGAAESVFVGKCPVFVFLEKEHFERFASELDNFRGDVAGYVHYEGGGYCHIVMNASRGHDRFYEVLAHEGTHAFMRRFLSSHGLPQWLNEGLADYIAAKVAPRSSAAKKYHRAVRKAVRKNIDVSYIFKRLSVNSFDYGIAQSIVRFMIDTNRKGFIKFVTLIKEGKSEEKALEESFNCDHEKLFKIWWSAVSRKYGA
ncbi:MAG: hypothetical protein ACYTF6_10405 [Planctomycetota bacterium]